MPSNERIDEIKTEQNIANILLETAHLYCTAIMAIWMIAQRRDRPAYKIDPIDTD